MQEDAERNQKHILWFEEVSMSDVPLAGGKNASLGDMYRNLTTLGVRVPNGFVITTTAYNYFLERNNLKDRIQRTLADLDTHNLKQLESKGKEVRDIICAGVIPDDLKQEIEEAYQKLGAAYFQNPDVAVRSSASAEDLPGASFAGQQETFLNVSGTRALLEATKKCFASLFTDRAISYRHDKQFDHFAVALSVGVQKMVRSDLATSGVAFTLDPDTGFDKVIVINGTYGLGELIVQGQVIPDEWIVFKPTLAQGYSAIIAQTLGDKNRRIVYAANGGTELQTVPVPESRKFCLSDAEVLQLAGWCKQIEDHFSTEYGRYQPMDIEWAKDGQTNLLYIVQARPETVHSAKPKNVLEEYALTGTGTTVITGIAIGTKIASGKARVIRSAEKIGEFQQGEILVTEMTDPDWEPIMKIAGGIVTDKGGRTSHAAIVSRELGVPCIVGTERGTLALKTGDEITLDCSRGSTGVVYTGLLPFTVAKRDLQNIPPLATAVMVNIGSPDEAFKNYSLPVKGVGLAREEFIIASHIKIHPKALLEYKLIKEEALSAKRKEPDLARVVAKIDELTVGYEDKTQYYVDKLAEGIARIAATFWPHQVIVRFSDFKTNEYRSLIGGERYEPREENPMLGWRGASRYYDEKFKDAFALEVRAMKKARETFGLTNVVPMIPMVRTVDEAQRVIGVIGANGLARDPEHNKTCARPVEQCGHLRIYMMCEVPSNVILADAFLDLVDGYSIGSNDLTQLTLGLDRDSGIVAHVGNESDEAVKSLIRTVIHACNEKGKYVGICGQAPSDIPGYAEFLVREGIQSISLNPDAVIKTVFALSQIQNPPAA